MKHHLGDAKVKSYLKNEHNLIDVKIIRLFQDKITTEEEICIELGNITQTTQHLDQWKQNNHTNNNVNVPNSNEQMNNGYQQPQYNPNMYNPMQNMNMQPNMQQMNPNTMNSNQINGPYDPMQNMQYNNNVQHNTFTNQPNPI